MAQLTDDLNFLANEAFNEALELAIESLEEARHCDNDWRLGVHLVMATSALRSALRIYGETHE